MGILAVAWQHLAIAAAAARALSATPEHATQEPATPESGSFLRGKTLAAEYWIRTEIPRLIQLAALCRSGEDSYGRVRPEDL